MVAGCGNACVKMVLFIINTIICLLGGAVCIVSIIVNVKGEDFLKQLLQDKPDADELLKFFSSSQTTLWVLAVLGGAVFLTGFLGCCGAACENKFMLYTYGAILVVIFIAELVVVILLLVKKDDLHTGIKKIVAEGYKDGNQGMFDVLKDWFKCEAGKTNESACADKVWGTLTGWVTTSGVVGILILVAELVAIIFTCVLAGAIGHRGYSSGYA